MLVVLTVLGGVSFVVLGLIFWVIGVRNGIVRSKNAVKRAWSDVITQERYKLKVIPKLEEALKEYADYEKGVMTNITELRTAVGGLSADNIDYSTLEKTRTLTQGLMSGLKVAVENYPELEASDLYKGWMNELSEAEENVAASIKIFNANVEGFNNLLQVFPNNLVNSRFNKEEVMNIFTESAAEGSFEYKPNF